jgi:hypothetical protein
MIEALPVRTGRALGLILLTAVLVLGMVFASSANAACYFTGGGCGFGSLNANTPTPWTGNYTTSQSWMDLSSDIAVLTVQIRPYTGASGYSWSSSGSTFVFTKSYPTQSVQHRCYHGGPFSKVSRCGFGVYPP